MVSAEQILDFDHTIENFTACMKNPDLPLEKFCNNITYDFEAFGLGKHSYFSFIETEIKSTDVSYSKLSLNTALRHRHLSSL